MAHDIAGDGPMIRLVLGGIAAVAAASGVFILAALRDGTGAFAACASTAVAGSGIGGPFALVDETGREVTDADVITGPTLVYFGYTSCPDVCPLDAVRNADAVDLLAAEGHVVLPVFITIDPERDTPERLAEFTDVIDVRMLGLTGSEEQVRGAIAAYKIYGERAGTGGESYLMSHSGFTYLTLPDLGVVDLFRSTDTAERIAETTACYIDAI